MKKFAVLFLILCLALSVYSCSTDGDDLSAESSVVSDAESSDNSEASDAPHDGEKLLLYSKKHLSSDGSVFETVTYSYDTSGVLKEKNTELYNGRKISEKYTYDPEGRLVSVVKEEDNDRSESKWTYDENGLLLEYSGVGEWEKYTYDSQGRIATRIVPDVMIFGKENTHVYRYDDEGNYTITGGEEDYIVVQYYTKDDVQYKMTVNDKITEEGKFDGNGNMISYTYYSDDGTVSGVNGYIYDKDNHLIRSIRFDDGIDSNDDYFSVWTYEYDELGNLVKETHTASDGTNTVIEKTYKYFLVDDK